MQKTLNETTSTGTAVVIGAGTMGRGIAADIANAGWNVHLWDVRREAAEGAKALLLSNRPPLLFLDSFDERITPGAFGENLPLLADADWVVEAVAESPEVKGEVFDRIEPHLGPRTIVTSNTSGLSLNRMASERGEPFRQRFFGTHFLNPPRYLKLLEVIPTADTNAETLAGFVRFAEGMLGHRVVVARDTPGFISTRLWISHLMDTVHATLEAGMGFDSVDALTGPFLGRPKSATFRMGDVVGLDIIAAIAANQYAALPDDPLRERLRLPSLMTEMLGRGWRGEKSGGGFYRREGREILVLDPTAMEYRPRAGGSFPATRLLLLPLPERLAALKARQDTPDLRFVNDLLDRLTDYAEAIGPHIADDVLSIDRTMQWGFGWELGPFAFADCRMESRANYAGETPRRTYRAFPDVRRSWPDEPEYISLTERKASGGLVETCATASLVDIGAGVYCVEFHSKMNTLGPEICDFLLRAVDRATRENHPLVIGNQGQHFCAGYDLARLVAHMEAKDWTAIDREMSACQRAFHALKYALVPVVAAPHGFTLGGGAEIALHCAAIQAAPELAFGLPETLVGLIPCGGGTKEVLRRVLKSPSPPDHPGFEPAEWFAAWWTLYIIARPETSANAHAAQVAGWLTSADRISRNPDRLLYDARELARHLFTDYAAPVPASILSLGPDGLNTTLRMSGILRWRGDDPTFTRYDARIADAVARLLSGDGATGTLTEQEYFDLERQLFLELCREPLTLARTRHLLETGKHLRN